MKDYSGYLLALLSFGSMFYFSLCFQEMDQHMINIERQIERDYKCIKNELEINCLYSEEIHKSIFCK